MKLINEQEIYDTWTPIIESKAGITDEGKKGWLSKYCHYHSLNESAGAYNSLGVVNGMGLVAPPAFPGMGNFTGSNAAAAGYGANQGFYNASNQGSGDKFPSLLPLAIQVAAKTVGFDIVPVIPMSGPTGILSYLDYVYAGGKANGATGSDSSAADALAKAPSMIKFPVYQGSATGITGATAGSFAVGSSYGVTSGGGTLTLTFVGLSRIDGFPIFEITAISQNCNVAQIIGGSSVAITNAATLFTGTSASANGYTAQLVKALEDHIQGFSGAGFSNDQDWQGPYVDGTKTYNPMLRNVGESTYYNSMGLSTFTKFIEAETFQVAASVTTEQIQDLNKQFGIDVISMIENALVNEVSQAINKHILSRAFALGWSNHNQFFAVENQNLNLNLVIAGAVGTTSSYINKIDQAQSMPIPAGPASGGYENLSTLQRRLFSRILAAANVVANRGRRGPANFIVTNANVASALQDISQFTFAPFSNTLTQNNGTLYPVGSLAGMTVYVDQNMRYDDTRVLIGRKGGDDEPGLKFMPYMMAESIQTISEGTMSPKIAVKSRYALVEAGFLPETMYLTFYVNVPTGGLA
jgi:hypothetical protein